MDTRYCLSIGRISKVPYNNIAFVNVNSFSKAKEVILKKGIPEAITSSFEIGEEKFVPFLKWLMHSIWDVNIDPRVPEFTFVSDSPSWENELEEARNLILSWKAYAR